MMSKEIWAWGCGSEGQLGNGKTADVLAPTRIEALHGLNVATIAAGNAHSTALLTDGSILTWGCGADGQLGHGTTANELLPARVDVLKGTAIVDVACGGQHTVALSSNGQVWSWGLGEYGQLGHGGTASKYIPTRISALDSRQVVQLACGWAHSVALTAKGEVYTWGRGFEGQLGVGKDTCSLAPRFVAALHGAVVTKIACGINFTAAVTDQGELYLWGEGASGQLGRGGNKSIRTQSSRVPVRVDLLDEERIVHVSCGWGHVAAVTDSDKLYLWGFGNYGQLANNSAASQYTPVAVEGLPGDALTAVACGDHTTNVLTKSRDVYTWGCGHNGRLGHGDVAHERLPRLLMQLQGQQIAGIAAGWKHTFAIIMNE
eukprot:TRINITY_DN15158_c0_g1_i1.p1 TRINITY_DN15158_c0_g1~~TRINITY_DN15158_c0_g1_i1.p1  ORF type:complete len:374 (+),score=45.87 TRINITY_DN15158_c0_g1_i1:36-1157(+)